MIVIDNHLRVEKICRFVDNNFCLLAETKQENDGAPEAIKERKKGTCRQLDNKKSLEYSRL